MFYIYGFEWLTFLVHTTLYTKNRIGTPIGEFKGFQLIIQNYGNLQIALGLSFFCSILGWHENYNVRTDKGIPNHWKVSLLSKIAVLYEDVSYLKSASPLLTN